MDMKDHLGNLICSLVSSTLDYSHIKIILTQPHIKGLCTLVNVIDDNNNMKKA